MSKINAKALMFLSIFMSSIIAIPTMSMGLDTQNNIKLSDDDERGLVEEFQGGFGKALGRFGPGGKILGEVFNMLFLNAFKNIESSEMMNGVFVLNAYNESTSYREDSVLNKETDIYYLPEEYYNDISIDRNTGQKVYCNVTKSGSFNITLTVGAGVTLIIWDNDKSFINALVKLINFFRDFDPDNITREIIRKGVQLVTWFLIHINDIFNGDEMFILNPITWQKLELDPGLTGVTMHKEWYVTDPNEGPSVMDDNITQIVLDNRLNETDNEYLKHLANSEDIEINNILQWTQFTFDLFQLWIKNFQINIDVSQLARGGRPEFGELFKGLDIEFYLFTHHLAGAFLYDDNNTDNTLTFNAFTEEQYSDSFVPNKNEITHRIFLGDVDDFDYKEPTLNGNKISWGLNITGAEITPVPLGVSLDSYQANSTDELEYIYFGFSFDPKISEIIEADDGKRYRVASAPIKLDQYFAPWNNLTNPVPKSYINNLDLAIIYVSTALHFHLSAEVTNDEDYVKDQYIGDPYQAHHNETHKLSIGNYLHPGIANKLDFVELADEGYYIGNQQEITSRDQSYKHNVTTSVIPIALWQYEMARHDTFSVSQVGMPDTPENVETYSTNISLKADFQVVAYAICYPDFDGTGYGILHDPTFNVFMIFEPTVFWAIFLLIGGVSLVGVATILIKRRKDSRTPF